MVPSSLRIHAKKKAHPIRLSLLDALHAEKSSETNGPHIWDIYPRTWAKGKKKKKLAPSPSLPISEICFKRCIGWTTAQTVLLSPNGPDTCRLDRKATALQSYVIKIRRCPKTNFTSDTAFSFTSNGTLERQGKLCLKHKNIWFPGNEATTLQTALGLNGDPKSISRSPWHHIAIILCLVATYRTKRSVISLTIQISSVCPRWTKNAKMSNQIGGKPSKLVGIKNGQSRKWHTYYASSVIITRRGLDITSVNSKKHFRRVLKIFLESH